MATRVIILDTTLKEIADAIRAKNGETTQYLPSEMAKAILALSTSAGGGGAVPADSTKSIYKKVVKTGADGSSENWDATEDFEFTVPAGITKVKLFSGVSETTFEFVDGDWATPTDITVSPKGTVINVQAGKTYRFGYWLQAKANQDVTFEVTCGGSVENETALSTKVPVFA